ncbi:AbiH family protein [Enterococcus termitis]|uniref:Bacteriophage abortive infection AbiH n=1 Tax=Enterococcus termitis TaxID=332950 RepID=A0A1E5H546_9ENTE|nr:AbiH family protein [Enterococcus termitis]OEG20002.1 hypothetical protein BCR25_14530 [Enterococcus termitis]OJG97792.1 hypothetical protein RV18_GL000609 [Enterococcus termitis]
MSNVRQLIVIGNGFDLYCGIGSSYYKFFISKYKNDFGRKVKKMLFEEEKEALAELNCFDVIFSFIEQLDMNYWLSLPQMDLNNFCSPKDLYWQDIEAILSDYLSVIFSEKGGDIYRFMCSLDTKEYIISEEIYREWKIAVFPKDQPKMLHDKWKLVAFSLAKVLLAKYGRPESELKFDYKFASNQRVVKEFTEKYLLPMILKELNQFEDSFTSFLFDRIEVKNPKFNIASNSEKTLSSLVWDDSEISTGETSVLSFNYTGIPGENFLYRLKNVHGSINKRNIIFGVDFQKNKSIPIEFTKTYRTLSLENRDDEKELFGKETHILKFFGHSLGEADYSYFQSLFDSLNLYSSKIKLYFYVVEYGNKTIREVKEETFRRVTKLLNVYGSTFHNPDHGKNLMHKLILEGRIFIKELKIVQ